MSDATYHNSGRSIRFTAGKDYAAGEVIAFGTGSAVLDAPAALGGVANATIVGVYEFTKPTGGGTGRALGATVGFDTTSKEIADVSGADLYLGRVVAVATDADNTVLVAINMPAVESLA